jgi:hypothetical protein
MWQGHLGEGLAGVVAAGPGVGLAPPSFNMIRYFGVLSSHSRERPEVCPQAPPAPGRFRPEPAAGDQLSLDGLFGEGQETKVLRSGRSRFRWLLKRVFRADLETRSQCGGAMRWVEVATQRGAITRLLAKRGLAPEPPPAQRTDLSWAQLTLPFNR